jgi:hypothetical protein
MLFAAARNGILYFNGSRPEPAPEEEDFYVIE